MGKSKAEITDNLWFLTHHRIPIFGFYLQQVDEALTVKSRKNLPLCFWQEKRKRGYFKICQITLFFFKISPLRLNYLARVQSARINQSLIGLEKAKNPILGAFSFPYKRKHIPNTAQCRHCVPRKRAKRPRSVCEVHSSWVQVHSKRKKVRKKKKIS